MAKIEKLVEEAKKHLEDGEIITSSVMGIYKKNIMGHNYPMVGILIATNKSVVFYCKKLFGTYEVEVFPYENINSIEMGKNPIFGHNISFFAFGNKAEMYNIKTGEVDKFISDVKSNIGKRKDIHSTFSSSASIDVTEKIKKLAELHDAGILTEEEFTTKKKQLLGI